MKRKVEFVLGLVGGILGIISGISAMTIGGIGTTFNVVGSDVGSLGISAMILSTIGIIGAVIVNSKTKTGGWFMVIAAVGGVISVSIFYILPGVLLITGGLMALLKKDNASIDLGLKRNTNIFYIKK